MSATALKLFIMTYLFLLRTLPPYLVRYLNQFRVVFEYLMQFCKFLFAAKYFVKVGLARTMLVHHVPPVAERRQSFLFSCPNVNFSFREFLTFSLNTLVLANWLVYRVFIQQILVAYLARLNKLERKSCTKRSP